MQKPGLILTVLGIYASTACGQLDPTGTPSREMVEAKLQERIDSLQHELDHAKEELESERRRSFAERDDARRRLAAVNRDSVARDAAHAERYEELVRLSDEQFDSGLHLSDLLSFERGIVIEREPDSHIVEIEKEPYRVRVALGYADSAFVGLTFDVVAVPRTTFRADPLQLLSRFAATGRRCRVRIEEVESDSKSWAVPIADSDLTQLRPGALLFCPIWNPEEDRRAVLLGDFVGQRRLIEDALDDSGFTTVFLSQQDNMAEYINASTDRLIIDEETFDAPDNRDLDSYRRKAVFLARNWGAVIQTRQQASKALQIRRPELSRAGDTNDPFGSEPAEKESEPDDNPFRNDQASPRADDPFGDGLSLPPPDEPMRGSGN